MERLVTMIFADHNTSRKVLIVSERENSISIQKSLNKREGGNWVLIDALKNTREYLLFDDKFIYKGYHESIKRYSTGIKEL
jgi:hypothetical protein